MKDLEKEEYETINDLSKTGFEKITDKGLVNFSSTDVRDGDRVVTESNRRLKKSIDKFNKNASRQTKGIIWLTIALGVLAIIQIIILLK